MILQGGRIVLNLDLVYSLRVRDVLGKAEIYEGHLIFGLLTGI